MLGGDDDPKESQEVIRDLFGALDKAMMEVRTKTFANYTNDDGVVLNGTDAMTFGNGVPPAPDTQRNRRAHGKIKPADLSMQILLILVSCR